MLHVLVFSSYIHFLWPFVFSGLGLKVWHFVIFLCRLCHMYTLYDHSVFKNSGHNMTDTWQTFLYAHFCIIILCFVNFRSVGSKCDSMWHFVSFELYFRHMYTFVWSFYVCSHTTTASKHDILWNFCIYTTTSVLSYTKRTHNTEIMKSRTIL